LRGAWFSICKLANDYPYTINELSVNQVTISRLCRGMVADDYNLGISD
jgi:hypothetical protein